MDKTTKHIIEKTNQNSIEYGPAKKRVKLFFEDAEDLKNKIKSISELMDEDWVKKAIEPDN